MQITTHDISRLTTAVRRHEALLRYARYLLIYILNGKYGGESGIRTHGTVLPYTRFPSVRLKPLGHLSGAHLLPARAGFFKGKTPRRGASRSLMRPPDVDNHL